MIGVIVFPPLVVVLDASIVVVAGEPFFGDGLFFPPAPVINQNVTVIILYYDFFLFCTFLNLPIMFFRYLPRSMTIPLDIRLGPLFDTTVVAPPL